MILPALTSALALALAAAPYRTANVSHPGAIHGVVTYAGKEKPRPAVVTGFEKDSPCGAEQPDRSLLLDEKRHLANAVVWLVDIHAGKKLEPTAGAGLDQQGCVYVPHVQAVAAGSKVKLDNSDAVVHSVNARLGEETVFNLVMPAKNMSVNTSPLMTPGVLAVRCEVGHPWMAAYIHVFDQPYFAVTKEDGAFALEGVPPGKYRLGVWHERLGQKTFAVTVAADQTATFDPVLK